MWKNIKILWRRVNGLYIMLTQGGVAFARKQGVTVGSGCRIYTSNFGSEPFLISIGNNVTITSGVKFITHDGSAWLMRDERGRRFYYAPIIIGNEVFVGLDTIIMPGVKICDRVIIAAGSVVTKSIPSGVVVGGVPARIIGKYEDIERRMLNNHISEDEIDYTLDYADRIREIVHNQFKPYLKDD